MSTKVLLINVLIKSLFKGLVDNTVGAISRAVHNHRANKNMEAYYQSQKEKEEASK